MSSCSLSVGSIRFLIPPTPTEAFCLPCGQLTQVPLRPHWGSQVPHCRDTFGVGAFFTPGSRYPPIPLARPGCLIDPFITVSTRFSVTLRNDASSKVHLHSPVRTSPRPV